MTLLERLKRFSIVVADTGDFDQLAHFSPRDATTNPTLVLQAARISTYRPVLQRVVAGTLPYSPTACSSPSAPRSWRGSRAASRPRSTHA